MKVSCWKPSLCVISSMCFLSNLHYSSTSSLFHQAKNSKYATESMLFSRSQFKRMVLPNGKRSVEHLRRKRAISFIWRTRRFKCEIKEHWSWLIADSAECLVALFLTLNYHSLLFSYDKTQNRRCSLLNMPLMKFQY